MATAYISTNTELSLVNTISQNLTLFLPENPLNGRNLFIKDAAGNSFRSSITLSTLGTNTFENGSVLQTLNSAYESMQLTYNSSKWYFTGGMMFNTLRVSTLQSQTTQTSNLSTLNATVSSFQISDARTSSIGTFNTVSSFLLYNGFNIGGGLRTAIPQTLNRFRFSLFQIPFFNMWLDGNDATTIILNGATVSQWNDKSLNSNFVSQTSVGSQPTYSPPGILFNPSRFFNTKILNSTRQETVIGVIQCSDILTASNILSASGNASRQIYIVSNSIRIASVNVANLVILAITSIGTNMFLFSVVYNYSSSYGAIFVNGGSLSSTSAAATIANNPFTASGFSLLGTTNATLYELFQYNRELSTIQRQQVEGYLAWKWGLQTQLPATHPYFNAPPQ